MYSLHHIYTFVKYVTKINAFALRFVLILHKLQLNELMLSLLEIRPVASWSMHGYDLPAFTTIETCRF